MEKLVSVCIPVYNEEELVIRALDSIPERPDIEIIITDDCSTDATYDKLIKYKGLHKNKDIKIFKNDKNMGVGYTTNKCFDNATGVWIMPFDSDDFIYTDKFIDFIENELDIKYDLVYFDLETNQENPSERYQYKNVDKYHICCGSVKFIKREWLGDLRSSNRRLHHDLELHQKMWLKNPKAKFTGVILVHYNFPKVGSLSYKYLHKEIDDYGEKL